MASSDVQRKLTAILCADVVGYSRLMGENEPATLRLLTEYRQVFFDHIEKFRGRIVNAPGDSIMAEFASVVDAVEGASEIQRELAERNAELLEDRRMQFRIGVNLGDVLAKEGDIFGDGVNIAARLESLAEPGGICISRPVYDQVKQKLKLHFEYMGEQQVKNIAEPVRAYQVRITSGGEPARKPLVSPHTGGAQPLGKPSIAVLAFDTMSDDPEQRYLADGIVEDIITELSRFKWFDVIARNSSFVYRGKSVDLREVSKEFGVRYVVEGSVRKFAKRVRITIQLIEATTGNHVWADKYDCALEEIFDLQDGITARIVASISPEVYSAEVSRARRRSRQDLDVWNCAVRGRWHVTLLTEDDSKKAKEFLYKALELDSDHVETLALLVYSHLVDLLFGWSESPPDSIGKAQEHLKAALSLDEKHPWVLCSQGMLLFVKGEQDQAIESFRKGIEVSPNFAVAFGYLSLALAHAGDPTEAIAMGNRALHLSPHDPELVHMLAGIGTAHFVSENYQEAVCCAKKMLQTRPSAPVGPRLLAVSLAHLGRVEEARKAVKELLVLRPDMTVTGVRKTIKFKHSEHTEKYLDGLLLAGLPE